MRNNGRGGRVSRSTGGPFEAGAGVGSGTETGVAAGVGAGRVVATWQAEPGPAGGRRSLMAAVADGGGAFGPTDLLPADETLDSPEVPVLAVNARGTALVAYLASATGGDYDTPATLKVSRLP